MSWVKKAVRQGAAAISKGIASDWTKDARHYFRDHVQGNLSVAVDTINNYVTDADSKAKALERATDNKTLQEKNQILITLLKNYQQKVESAKKTINEANSSLLGLDKQNLDKGATEQAADQHKNTFTTQMNAIQNSYLIDAKRVYDLYLEFEKSVGAYVTTKKSLEVFESRLEEGHSTEGASSASRSASADSPNNNAERASALITLAKETLEEVEKKGDHAKEGSVASGLFSKCFEALDTMKDIGDKNNDLLQAQMSALRQYLHGKKGSGKEDIEIHGIDQYVTEATDTMSELAALLPEAPKPQAEKKEERENEDTTKNQMTPEDDENAKALARRLEREKRLAALKGGAQKSASASPETGATSGASVSSSTSSTEPGSEDGLALALSSTASNYTSVSSGSTHSATPPTNSTMQHAYTAMLAAAPSASASAATPGFVGPYDSVSPSALTDTGATNNDKPKI